MRLKTWCKHIKVDGIFYNLESINLLLATDDTWIYCPICGKRNPYTKINKDSEVKR